ncbi:MAG: hypothetical protein JXA42_22630 [Anaerolineales bacterium]|nr:hypothetical protein [Anaerolineales bacterium]
MKKPNKRRDSKTRIMSGDLAKIMVVMAAAYLLGAPYILAGWGGVLELPASLEKLGGLLPYLALALAVGGVGIIAVLQLKKWGALFWGVSWIAIWIIIFLSTNNPGILISAAFSSFILVIMFRTVWRTLT